MGLAPTEQSTEPPGSTQAARTEGLPGRHLIPRVLISQPWGRGRVFILLGFYLFSRMNINSLFNQKRHVLLNLKKKKRKKGGVGRETVKIPR